MELKNNKQGKIDHIKVYCERIKKLAPGIQTLTTNSFLTTIFQAVQLQE